VTEDTLAVCESAVSKVRSLLALSKRRFEASLAQSAEDKLSINMNITRASN